MYHPLPYPYPSVKPCLFCTFIFLLTFNESSLSLNNFIHEISLPVILEEKEVTASHLMLLKQGVTLHLDLGNLEFVSSTQELQYLGFLGCADTLGKFLVEKISFEEKVKVYPYTDLLYFKQGSASLLIALKRTFFTTLSF